MQWLQPWAFAALPLLAVPVVVHLFSRRPPKVQVFPTLRFLEKSTARPTRRSRLSDILLMLVRATLILVAIAALAQPLLERTEKGISSKGVTAIVIDNGVISSEAESIAADTLTVSGPTGSIRKSIWRSANWLQTRPAPRTIVVRSGFPLGAVDSSMLSAIPSDVSLVLERSPQGAETGSGSHPADSSYSKSTVGDTIFWITALGPPDVERIVASVRDREGSEVIPSNPSHPPVMGRHKVLITAPAGITIDFDSTSPGTAERTRVLFAVARDLDVQQRAKELSIDRDLSNTKSNKLPYPLHSTPLAFNSQEAVIVGGLVDGNAVVMSLARESGTLARSLLAAVSEGPKAEAIRRLDAIDAPLVSDESLRNWAHLPAAKPVGPGLVDDIHTVNTHARWLWLAVLLLLGGEWQLRKRTEAAGVDSR